VSLLEHGLPRKRHRACPGYSSSRACSPSPPLPRAATAFGPPAATSFGSTIFGFFRVA